MERSYFLERKNYDDSIFIEQYERAFRLIDGLCCSSVPGGANIVCFTGDRGEGKTSCMMSVAHLLECRQRLNESGSVPKPDDDLAHARDFLAGIGVLDRGRVKFDFMGVIDPSFFDGYHNVLELFIGKYYKKYISYVESHRDVPYETRNRVTKLFANVKSDIMCAGKAKMDDVLDPVEELEGLAAADTLRDDIKELMHQVNKLTGCDRLLIQIDDLDLCISTAYTMAEQIRKYLVNDECLILMAIKIDQLQRNVANAMMADAAPKNKYDFQQMAARYTDKFIPTGYRIEMPKVYDLSSRALEVYGLPGAEGPVKFASIKSGVVRRIFATCRFLFYNDRGGTSAIIPNNLRGFLQLLGVIFSMDTLDFSDARAQLLSANKHTFKAFFFGPWISSLSDQYRAVAESIISRTDDGSLNKYVVQKLDNSMESKPDSNLYKAVIDKANYAYNISVGDVLYMADELDRTTFDNDLKRFLFFIKSFYSIKLFENYDIVTESREMVYPPVDKKAAIYKIDELFNNTNPYQRLVSGVFFTYMPGDLLPLKQGSIPRDLMVLDGQRQGKQETLSPLNALFANVVPLANEIQRLHQAIEDVQTCSPGQDIEDVGTVADEATREEFVKSLTDRRRRLIAAFRLAEYLALSVVSAIEAEYTLRYQNAYRKRSIPFYLENFNKQKGYYVYDVMGIFGNMTNPEYAYSRFDELCGTPDNGFFKLACEVNWSLLNSMSKASSDDDTADVGDWDTFRSLLSDAGLRNTEIISAIMERARNLRNYTYRESSTPKVIAVFYKRLQDTGMATYNRGEGEAPYKIDFRFLSPVIEMLNVVGESGKVELDGLDPDIFDTIFERNNAPAKSTAGIGLDVPKFRTGEPCKTLSMPNLMKRMLSVNPGLEDRLDAADWLNLFPGDKSYPIATVIQRLTDFLAKKN